MNNPFDNIIGSLFVGNKSSPEIREFDMIVNCTPDVAFPMKYYPLCIRIPIRDDPFDGDKLLKSIEDSNVLELIYDYINAGKSVLVHCSMGMQRSCAVVACYLIKYQSMIPKVAVAYIKSRRPVAFLGNVNFTDAIDKFYRHQLPK